MTNLDKGEAATEQMFGLVGNAINRWSFVEEKLCWIFMVCIATVPVIGKYKTGLSFSHCFVPMRAFHSVESLRGKLNLVDSVVVGYLAGMDGAVDDLKIEWGKLHEKTRKLSLRRNRLAHHTVLPGMDLEDRVVQPRLVPPIGSPRYYRETGLRSGKETRSTEQIKHLIRAFCLLDERLQDYALKLAKHEGLFDRYAEQVVDQIRSHSQTDPSRAERLRRALSSLE